VGKKTDTGDHAHGHLHIGKSELGVVCRQVNQQKQAPRTTIMVDEFKKGRKKKGGAVDADVEGTSRALQLTYPYR
jgi:hypothetical protein